MSPSALSQAASGRKLPTWNVTRAFVKGCGGDEKVWYEQWSQVRQELNVRQTNTTNGEASPPALGGKAPESALRSRAPKGVLGGKAPEGAPHDTTGIRQRPALVRTAMLLAVAAVVLLGAGIVIVINWVYGQEEVDPAAAGSPPVITTFIHGEYQGVAGLYETPRPSQADINKPPYTVQRTGELNIVCQVSNGTVMKAVLVNATSGVEREEENDIWYHVIPSNYYVPAIYTTFPYGVEGMLPPGQPYGTTIPQCTGVP